MGTIKGKREKGFNRGDNSRHQTLKVSKCGKAVQEIGGKH
jgi:hypothetical protein